MPNIRCEADYVDTDTFQFRYVVECFDNNTGKKVASCDFPLDGGKPVCLSSRMIALDNQLAENEGGLLILKTVKSLFGGFFIHQDFSLYLK